jgi:hypothetical protein
MTLLKRITKQPGDDGNMVLFLLVLVASSSLVVLTLGAAGRTATSVRHVQKSVAALPPADAGIQEALYYFNAAGANPTGVPAPPTSCTSAATANAPLWGAVQDSAAPLTWHVTSLGCKSGFTRTVTADLGQRPRFAVGAFARSSAGTHGTSSGVTSYGSSGNLGTIGSNGSLSFTGNPAVDKIILYNFTPPNDNYARCSGNPCSPLPPDPASKISTDPNIFPARIEDVPAGSADPNQFIVDQLNACQAANGGVAPGPWVASAHGYRLTYTGSPQCYSTMTFDGATTTNGTAATPIQVYVSGTIQMTMNGNASAKIVNHAGLVAAGEQPDSMGLQIYSHGTTVSFVNQSTFVGNIWAPYAACGGTTSSASSDIYGSLICDIIDNQGGWNFHFDERLLNAQGLGQWSVRHYAEQ